MPAGGAVYGRIGWAQAVPAGPVVPCPADLEFLDAAAGALLDDPDRPSREVARALYLSPSRFAHRFRSAAGLPPGAYRVALRLQRAKRLLAESEWSVLRVALEVGYDSLGTFSRRFASLVGTPPGRFRNLADGSGADPTVARVSRALEARFGTGAGAVAFVGLFPQFLPAGRPVAGTLAAVPGTYCVAPCPPGTYHVLAAAFPPAAAPEQLLLSDAWRVAGEARPVTVDRGGARRVDLWLRPPRPADPPVIVSLALLRPDRPMEAAPTAAAQLSRIEEVSRRSTALS